MMQFQNTSDCLLQYGEKGSSNSQKTIALQSSSIKWWKIGLNFMVNEIIETRVIFPKSKSSSPD